MTNNSKKRKFLATSLTATMVATAVAPVAGFAAEAGKTFPDVPANHWAAEDIAYLVSTGAIKGTPDGKFNPSDTMTRAAAAQVLAISLGLDVVDGAKSKFADVNGTWGEKYIAAIEDKGIIQGKGDGSFDPAGKLTRQAMAEMLVKAYDLKLNEKADVNFSDNTTWAKDQIQILASLGVLTGINGKAEPTKTLTRAEAAAFVHRAEVEDARKPVATLEAKVVSVSAINTTDLLVTVKGVKEDLKASDFEVTVGGNKATVSATKVSETEYNLQLTVPLVDGDVVVVKGAGEILGSASTTYKDPVYTKVEAIEGIVYENIAGQVLQVRADGKIISESDLAKQGYSVEFQATKGVFAGGSQTSSTGILDVSATSFINNNAGESFEYKVSISKDNKVLTSEYVTMTIAKEETTAASDIKSYTLSAITEVDNSSRAITSLTSGKLVVGEEANFTTVIADLQDGRKDVNLAALTDSNIQYESSDVTIARVDQNGKITTPGRTGKVTITIKSGTKTRDVELEVVSQPRELTTAVVAANAQVKLVQGSTKTVTLTAKDQYGDIYNTSAIGTDVDSVNQAVANKNEITTTSSLAAVGTGTTGAFTIDVTAHAINSGSGSIILNNGSKKVATINVSVAKETGQVQQKLVATGSTIDLNPANKTQEIITFNLENLFNGHFKGNADYNGLQVEIFDAGNSKTPLYSFTQSGQEFDLEIDRSDLINEATGITSINDLKSRTAASIDKDNVDLANFETGTALVVVKDASGKEIDKINFSVVDTAANATSATFASNVDFTDNNASGSLNLADLLTKVDTSAAPYDGVLRYDVVAGKPEEAIVYFSSSANVGTYDFANGDVLVGKVVGTAVTPGDSVNFSLTGSNFFAKEISVDHFISKKGDKAQFNFYKRGDVSVGKHTFVKKDEVAGTAATITGDLVDGDTTVAGTTVAGSTVEISVTGAAAPVTATVTGTSYTATVPALVAGDVVTVTSKEPGKTPVTVTKTVISIDQAAANVVIAQITAANNRADIEAARTAYNGLSADQKALVTNEQDLQDKEQGLVDAITLSVSTSYAAADAGTTVVIDAQSGFTYSITGSDATGVIDNNGKIVGDGTAELTVEVTHTSSSKTAIKTVSVTVAP